MKRANFASRKKMRRQGALDRLVRGAKNPSKNTSAFARSEDKRLKEIETLKSRVSA